MGDSAAPEGPVLTANLSSAAALAALVEAANALAAVARAMGAQPSTQSAPPLSPDPITLTEAVNQFLVAKARSGRSDRYLRQIRSTLGDFTRGRARRPLQSVTADELERWMGRDDWSPRTRAGHLLDVRTLLAWCHRRGWINKNVALGVEKPTGPDRRSIQIHTPDQARQLLEFARERNPDVCRHLAVRYFCGIRSAEAHRITEVHLLQDRGFLEVPAVAAKTRSRRLVKLQPNLEAWLGLGGVLRPLSPNTVQAVIRASGVPWPHNVTRHSWCSYHLAQWENAGRTALEAGHAEAVLFRHYRALVSTDQAEAFWSITPA